MLASAPLPYSEAVESPPADEVEDMQEVVAVIRRLLAKSYAATGKHLRDVHVKGHGCAVGELQVLSQLPPELAQGLFAQVATYPATVRFSNASPQPLPDAVPDGRGLAIQIQNVHGEFLTGHGDDIGTQDFILVNHPTFLAANVKNYLRLEQLRLTPASPSAVSDALFGGEWNPLSWHWREVLTAARIAGKFPAHPAAHTYYSMAPFRYGAYVCKYRVAPAGSVEHSSLQQISRLVHQPDAMRQTLEETLRTGEVLFDFQVQLRTSEQMPVEDATAEWPESESPYRTVARLVLPMQDIRQTQAREDSGELFFDVWHTLAAHRPLGGINRVRRLAYQVSAEWRAR